MNAKIQKLIEEISNSLAIIAPPMEMTDTSTHCAWCECEVSLDKNGRFDVGSHADDCPYRAIDTARDKLIELFAAVAASK